MQNGLSVDVEDWFQVGAFERTIDRADWPNIDRWLGNIAALPGWKHPYDMMPGRPSDRA